MEALQCNPALGELRLIQVDRPVIINPNDVVIKVAYAGLCGTDLHILSGEFKNCAKDFVTISHEFSGVVEEVGDAVQDLQVGDRVGVDPNRPCARCKFCRKGQVQHCQNGGTRDGIGVFRNGGMANFCVAPEDQVHKLPTGLTLEQAALCEPLSCILHGWNRLNSTGCLQPDSRILITGAGIIGNLWVAMFHHHGYRDVTVSEPLVGRRNITEQIGTGYRVTIPADLEQGEADVDTEQHGFDVVVECSGFPPALQQAVSWTARGAAVIVFGCAPAGRSMVLCPEEVFRKELTILGCLVNPNTYSRALRLASVMAHRYFDYTTLGIEIFKIQEYKEAISKLKAGQISKAVFKLNIIE